MLKTEKNYKNGFTLLEILISLALSGIIITGIFSAYIYQLKLYKKEKLMIDMQQNIRAGMHFMETELRLTGHDPLKSIYNSTNLSIKSACNESIHFTTDITDNSESGNPDGDYNDKDENIIYSLYDSGSDGDTDLGRKKQNGKNQLVAENIDALNFIYMDGDSPISILGINTPCVTSNIKHIKLVQISIVARVAKGMAGYKNNETYKIRLPDNTEKIIYSAPGDNFKRMLLTTRVFLRNLNTD